MQGGQPNRVQYGVQNQYRRLADPSEQQRRRQQQGGEGFVDQRGPQQGGGRLGDQRRQQNQGGGRLGDQQQLIQLNQRQQLLLGHQHRTQHPRQYEQQRRPQQSRLEQQQQQQQQQPTDGLIGERFTVAGLAAVGHSAVDRLPGGRPAVHLSADQFAVVTGLTGGRPAGHSEPDQFGRHFQRTRNYSNLKGQS